jgi:hypothetical protein
LISSDTKKAIKAYLGREPVRQALNWALKWPAARPLAEGYSLILGVPWHLRHLLNVNLEFIARTQSPNLRAVHVVLDRKSPKGRAELEQSVAPHLRSLPLHFHCYSGIPGRIVEMADVSTFYNGMNCYTALSQMTTRHAILHDFDLYPLDPAYFEKIYQQMRDQDLKFCGVEYTHFDGLQEEDRVLGTWGLGMDVEYLYKNHKPVDIFHRLRIIRGRPVSLDPFSEIQLFADARRDRCQALTTDSFCHVKNLCSSYLRLMTGRPVTLAWRLHYLWYLENLQTQRSLEPVVEAMNASDNKILRMDGRDLDYAVTHHTCANVLQQDLERMDRFFFGEVRDVIQSYVGAFRRFLQAESMG